MNITRAVAIDRSRETLGVGAETTAEAQEIASPGQLLPFVDQKGSVWKIHCDDIKLTVTESDKKRDNPYVRSVDVYISSATGQIVKIESVWPKGATGKAFPSLKRQEEQMRRVSQTFIGLPEKAPKVSFREALEKAHGAAQAKQIVAYYVTEQYSDPKTEPRAVWVIHAWGIPAFVPPVPKGGSADAIPKDARNHLRSIIDAETGEWYGADTIPQPE